MRILAILPCLPFPPDTGQKHRFHHLLREVARHAEVALLCFADARARDAYGGEHRDSFASIGLIPIASTAPSGQISSWLSPEPSEVRQFSSPAMTAAVAEAVATFRPDVLLSGDPALTRYVLPYPEVPRVLDYVCEVLLQARRMQRHSQGATRAIWALRRMKFGRYLRSIAGIYDLCLLNSQEDLDSLREVWPGVAMTVLANGLPLDEYSRIIEEPTPNRLVYPGSITYQPNFDAVDHFATEILPRIRGTIPEVEFHVTGALPPAGARPDSPGLVYTGYVEDVRREIARSWACVVPLRLGAGGARLKVLECLALGTPMVSTAVGYEGVEVTDGVDILAADDASLFAERAIAILRSRPLRERIAAGGRALMAARYDVRSLGRRYGELLRGVVERRMVKAS